MTATPANTILVVEARPTLAASVRDVLAAAGFTPTVVPTAEEAVRAIEEDGTISVVLLDSDPEYGVRDRTVAPRIIEIRDVPVVFLTDHVAADDDGSRPTLKESFHTTLAETVSVALEASASQRELAEERARRQELEDAYRSFVQSFDGIAFRVPLHGAPVFMHGRVEEITGYTEDDFVSRRVTWADLMPPEDRETMRSELSTLRTTPGHRVEHEHRLVRADGSVAWVSARMSSVADENGDVGWIQGVVSDVTHRKTIEENLQAALAEKDALVREMNHRTKNNIALLRSLVSLQAARTSDPAAMGDVAAQVNAIGLVHEKLQQAEAVTDVPVGDYLRDLADSIFAAGGHADATVEVAVPDVPVPSKLATSLGLLVNELATNAMKHAFPESEHRRFSVSLDDRADDELVLTVENDGPPLPEALDFDAPSTLGLRLVSMLVAQMEGELEVRRAPTPRFTIRLPRS